LRDVGDLVDVELNEVGVGELFGELYDLRGNDLAGSAPGCERVEDNDLVVLNSGLEFCFAAREIRQ
jgi:hypothetical protein